MSDFQVIRIPIWPLAMVNAYLVKGPTGCILVDSGMPGSERKIEQALKANHLSLKDLKLIVITHAHADHAGSAAKMRSLSGTPIVAHEGDLKFYLRQEPMSYCPTSAFARLLYKSGAPLEPYEAFRPEILLSQNQTFDLRQHGFRGTLQHTPGHTAGSLSVVLEGKQALVGDMLASGIFLGGILFKNRPIRPPFEENPQEVARELQRLLDQGTRHFYVGHGGPLKAEAVKRHVEALLRLKPGS